MRKAPSKLFFDIGNLLFCQCSIYGNACVIQLTWRIR